MPTKGSSPPSSSSRAASCSTRSFRLAQSTFLNDEPAVKNLFTLAGLPRASYRGPSATPGPPGDGGNLQDQLRQQRGGTGGGDPPGDGAAAGGGAGGEAPRKKQRLRATELESGNEDDDAGDQAFLDAAEVLDDAAVGVADAYTLAESLLNNNVTVSACSVPKHARKTFNLAQSYRKTKLKDQVARHAPHEPNLPVRVATVIIHGLDVDYGKVSAHDPGQHHIKCFGSATDELFVPSLRRAGPFPTLTLGS